MDALDWLVYEQVSRTHALPNLKRLKNEGAWGDLRSIEPLISPLIWTTIVTGVTPDEHGIMDFLVESPQTGEEVPVTSWMRRVPALWNMCAASGLSSGFIGWFASFVGYGQIWSACCHYSICFAWYYCTCQFFF